MRGNTMRNSSFTGQSQLESCQREFEKVHGAEMGSRGSAFVLSLLLI